MQGQRILVVGVAQTTPEYKEVSKRFLDSADSSYNIVKVILVLRVTST